MIHNGATPKIEIDPETYDVTADGGLLVCESADKLPMAPAISLSRKSKMHPKLFISYSWSGSEHVEWVIEFATELRAAGVDVVLDKWDLREGNEAHAFMERMVGDKAITKVVLICDSSYAEKANIRAGGVGTEAQIITPEIYAKSEQNKIVAVVRERDGNNKPFLPIYYGSRIYIDLSDESTYAENFDQLLRWVYDKPIYVKPDLGTMPAYLAESPEKIHISATIQFRRAVDALKNGRSNALPALKEYFTFVSSELERFRIQFGDLEPDELIVDSISQFIPVRNELIDLVFTISSYGDVEGTREVVHSFLETLIPYFYRPRGVNGWNEMQCENFKFIVHELFLYILSCYLRNQCFAAIDYLLSKPYLDRDNPYKNELSLVSYLIFNNNIESLQRRNQRLNLRCYSLRANILKERCNGHPVSFEMLMEIDFLLYLRSIIVPIKDRQWYPELLVYIGHHYREFEALARARSKNYFDKLRLVLGVNDKSKLINSINSLESEPKMLLSGNYGRFTPSQMIKLNEIATLP